MKFIAGLVAIVAMIGGLLYWFDATTPHSTHGVTIVGDNEARLPVGETFILLHQVGKVTAVWHVTYDGARTVSFVDHQGWPFGDDTKTGTVKADGSVTDVDFGWGDHFYVSLRPDGAASVRWPDGFDYRA